MNRIALSAPFLLASLALAGCPMATDMTDMTDGDVTDGDTGTPAPGNIVEVATEAGVFGTLLQALQDAGLDDDLAGAGPFTVFAPTDDAFADVDLSGLSPEALAEILSYHVIPANVPSSAVPALADSLATYTLFFDTSDGVAVNGVDVDTADVAASNGVIHIIDDVLMPPDILDAAGFAGLTSLASTIGAADPAVATTLGGAGPFTVFAPDNDAFTTFTDSLPGTPTQEELTSVLLYHVFDGSVTSDIVPAKADSLLENTWGNGVTALFDTSNGVVVNGSSTVSIADVITTNGVVHVVREVLVPPTIVDTAANAGLTGLLTTVGAASGDLGTVLSGAGPFTVFAPDNMAFDDIASTAKTLTADQLRDVLLFHVVDTTTATPVLSTALSNGEVPTALTGQSVTVNIDGAAPTVEGAEVAIADINTTNGVVHVIDAVMLPAAR